MFLQQRLNKERCLNCKRRKKKCELVDDKCIYCLKKGLECQFSDMRTFQHANIGKPKAHKNSEINTNGLESNSITTVGLPKIFLPIKIMINSNGSPELHEDCQLVEVYNDEALISESFSLFDFILSGSRIGRLESGACDVENYRLNIAEKNQASERQDVVGFFASCNMTLPRHEMSKKINQARNFQDMSLEDIDIEINIEALKNVLFIAQAAVTKEVNHEKFVNLPEYIGKSFADRLFNHFCDMYSENEKGRHNKVSLLKVCLPLIFGNVSVLKCVLVSSYYHMLVYERNDDELLEMKDSIHILHVEVLSELKERLEYYSSVSCDHSLLCVLLLLTVELVNGAKGKLWARLHKLALDMITLKGGVEQLSSTLTGLCLMKLLSVNLANELSLINLGSSVSQPLSLQDWFFFVSHKSELDFYDNFNCKSSFGLRELNDVVQKYGHIAMLNSMMIVSLGANVEEGVPVNETFVNYHDIGSVNLTHVLIEAGNLEKEVETSASKSDQSRLPNYHKLQIKFALLASKLYLYQLVYRQTSIAPKSILLVKELLQEVEVLFDVLDSMSDKESHSFTLIILPFFCLGVDIISDEVRTWFVSKLENLYSRTRRNMIETAIYLLKEVWKLNKDGNSCVDWRALFNSHSRYISLVC